MATSFSLLETILYEPEKGFYLVDGHIERLQRSVKQFQEARVGNFQEIPSADAVKCALKQAVENTSGHQRLRLLYDGQQLTVQTADFTPSIHNAHDTPNEAASSDEAFKITLDTVPLQSQTTDLFITCKTTYRDMYNTARERVRAGQDGLFDVVLWNQDGQVTETSIANITLRKHGRWVTPKLASGTSNKHVIIAQV
ncbi:aminotransferase [Syncephalastrum racemosum]|uniref:Aminotransferase n=1 Tax=Syncephalastrum racemosum TaxID=13706 RepID=A0A1X2HQF6_SYNRA|nr:aminotransferase [Syncephalastrum racemosum]